MADGKAQSSAEPELAQPAIIAAVPGGSAPSREEVLLIGSAGNLVSIVTHPAAPRGGAPAVVFLNAGVIHRVGPHRLHVTLARDLAAKGYAAVRVDLSGIGDSRPLSGDLAFRERAVADTRATMDEATALGAARRFVLFGLCSGADNALATALADDRVAGVVLVDPYTYSTVGSKARRVISVVRSLGGPRHIAAWGFGIAERRVRARVAALRAHASSRGRARRDEPARQNGREVPPRDVFGAQLAAIERRGVKILAIYSGTHGERYNHPDQVFDVFPHLRGKIERQYFPDVNHTFTELAAQRRIRATVTDWVSRHFS